MVERWRYRRALSADAVSLARIEQACFSDPWSRDAFEEVFASPFGLGLVAEGPEGIAGYLVARAVAGESEILNLAVSPAFRRRGLARRLLSVGLEALEAVGATEVFLEVRERNRAAQSLYRASGFVPVGRRAAYYRNPVEDAIVLRRTLERPA